MRKKFLLFMLTAISAVCLTAGLTACGSSSSGGESSGTTSDWGSGVYTVEAAYAEAQTLGYSGSLEDFITSISGTDGTNGEDGVDGSVWYTGSGAPSSSTGKDGDMYLDTASYDIYQMASGSWAKLGNIKGEAGVGTNGVGISSVTLNSNGELIVAYTDSTSTNLGAISTSCTHTYGEWVVGAEATCTSMGYKYRTCSACGDVDYAFIEATGHTFADDAVNSESYGHMLQCTTCHQIITESHTFDDNHICETCGFNYYSKGLEFYVYSSGNGIVTYGVTLGTCTDGEIIIPAEYKGYPVVAIGNSCFENYTTLTSITLPEGLITIGTNAFYGCTSLTSITIPDSVTTIGDSAFYGCTSLENLTIGSGVTTLDSRAFYGCTALTSISLPDGLTLIGRYVFTDTGYYNNDYNWLNGVMYIGNYLIEAKTSIYGSYTVLNGTTLIARSAFNGCDRLTNIVLPESLNYICLSSFYNCTSLASINIPESIISIAANAFYNCTTLASITIPDSVTTIGSSAFYGCTSLENLTIGSGVTTLDSRAFYGCTSLISIVIPNTVTYIGSNTFYGCTSFTSVYYTGTAEEWSEIEIDSDNTAITSATIYYYSESQPTDSGNYWHYDESGNIVVWATTTTD